MKIIQGFRGSNRARLAPEGLADYGEPQMESDLRLLGRREWWLWLSAIVVTLLSTLALMLSSVPSFFAHRDQFYEIGSEQATWGTMVLLLVFNTWLIYRQWFFRCLRSQLAERSVDRRSNAEKGDEGPALDTVTGFYTRASLEERLAREMGSSRRQNTPLSLLALHLDEFGQITERSGSVAGEQVLKEFARRVKKATRGSDFGAFLADDDFLLVLPECGQAAAKLVLDRLGNLQMKCGSQDITVTYSAGWIDYQSGESPGSLLGRAGQVLQLYKNASKDYLSPTRKTA
jgi:diguanylate cyclase (GGDEF)-like protein